MAWLFLLILFIIVSNILAKPDKYSVKAVFVADNNYLPLLLEDISRAVSGIDCAVYMFKLEGSEDSTGLIFLAMSDAVLRGVDVSVVLDYGTSGDLSTVYNTYTAKKLNMAGINVFFDQPDRKLHAKMCVIDNITYIGSHNYTFSAMKRNSEASVRIESSELAESSRIYIKNLINKSSKN